mgnify:CR=1 FL=1
MVDTTYVNFPKILFETNLPNSGTILNLHFTVCPTDQENYRWVDRHCYYLEMDPKSIEEAKVNCASKFQNSGKLFEPLSLQVNDLVWEEFKDTIVPGGRGPWIGVTDQETNSVFKYTSSGSVVSFTIPWFAGITLKPK